MIDNYAVEGAAAPLHIHHNEGELFYVIDGALTIWAGGKVIDATAGSFVYGPCGVPHTFVVTSPTDLDRCEVRDRNTWATRYSHLMNSGDDGRSEQQTGRPACCGTQTAPQP